MAGLIDSYKKVYENKKVHIWIFLIALVWSVLSNLCDIAIGKPDTARQNPFDLLFNFLIGIYSIQFLHNAIMSDSSLPSFKEINWNALPWLIGLNIVWGFYLLIALILAIVSYFVMHSLILPAALIILILLLSVFVYYIYLAYAERICKWIDDTYAEKELEMRSRLQEKVNNIFARMYHGERRVQIDNQYHVTLFAQMNGKEVITGESEGLKRVKNFAFIAGLVDLAKEKASLGKKSETITWDNEAYPLVMDAPFSNADETHIKNISGVLPEVANQVIMFVMEKDWQYAQSVMDVRVGKYCTLKKYSESHTEIES